MYEAPESFSVREDVGERHQESNKSELTVINCHQRHHRNHCHHRNQFPEPDSSSESSRHKAMRRQALLNRRNKKILLSIGIAVRIIRMHSWCVLIPPVRHGVTSWIVGIATGS